MNLSVSSAPVPSDSAPDSLRNAGTFDDRLAVMYVVAQIAFDLNTIDLGLSLERAPGRCH